MRIRELQTVRGARRTFGKTPLTLSHGIAQHHPSGMVLRNPSRHSCCAHFSSTVGAVYDRPPSHNSTSWAVITSGCPLSRLRFADRPYRRFAFFYKRWRAIRGPIADMKRRYVSILSAILIALPVMAQTQTKTDPDK